MTERDFYDWENGLNQGKFALFKPLLCNVQVVMFKKSETKMFWKESYLQEEFQSCIFLLNKIEAKIKLGKFPSSRREPRGRTTSKKIILLRSFCYFCQVRDTSAGEVWFLATTKTIKWTIFCG